MKKIKKIRVMKKIRDIREMKVIRVTYNILTNIPEVEL